MKRTMNMVLCFIAAMLLICAALFAGGPDGDMHVAQVRFEHIVGETAADDRYEYSLTVDPDAVPDDPAETFAVTLTAPMIEALQGMTHIYVQWDSSETNCAGFAAPLSW